MAQDQRVASAEPQALVILHSPISKRGFPMNNTTVAAGYDVVARTYDMFFTSHREWFQQIRTSILADILPNAKVVCDLGCGTGYTAINIAKESTEVFALDASFEMCRLARENAREAGVQLSVIQADMRTFQLPKPVDVVLAEFDVLNHLDAKSSLTAVAESVSRALVPGGYFYFDVNTCKVFQTAWPQVKGFAEQGDTVFVPHGGYDAERDKGWLVAEYFIRDGHRWRRVSERIEQVWWMQEEIQKTFEQAGFRIVRVVDASEMKLNGRGVVPPGFVVFYLAQKLGADKSGLAA
jgi:ubiquinone/menaquinone biosynthesis C-methylase UbiE